MLCSRCQHENGAAAKFCEECGTALARSCPRCGHAVAGAVKFCAACGHALAPTLANEIRRDPRAYTPPHLAEKILGSRCVLEGERKQVTVLFADVKGSMEWRPQSDRVAADPRLSASGEAGRRDTPPPAAAGGRRGGGEPQSALSAGLRGDAHRELRSRVTGARCGLATAASGQVSGSEKRTNVSTTAHVEDVVGRSSGQGIPVAYRARKCVLSRGVLSA